MYSSTCHASCRTVAIWRQQMSKDTPIKIQNNTSLACIEAERAVAIMVCAVCIADRGDYDTNSGQALFRATIADAGAYDSHDGGSYGQPSDAEFEWKSRLPKCAPLAFLGEVLQDAGNALAGATIPKRWDCASLGVSCQNIFEFGN